MRRSICAIGFAASHGGFPMVRPLTDNVGVHDQGCTSIFPEIFTARPERAEAIRSMGPFIAFQSTSASARSVAPTRTPSVTPVHASTRRVRRETFMSGASGVPCPFVNAPMAVTVPIAKAWEQNLRPIVSLGPPPKAPDP